MAIEIDTSSSLELIEEQSAEKRHKVFTAIKIILIAIICIIVVAAIINAVIAWGKISDLQTEYTRANDNFTIMKAQAEENQKNIEGENSNSDENKIDKNMYSAKTAGNRVCELLEMAYDAGRFELPEDSEEFYNLVVNADTPIWFGSGLNPSDSPVDWEFLTWYDSTDGHKYKTVWGCYTPDLNYLLYIQYANYDGESNQFTLEGNYVTTFGQMYLENGYVESDGGPTDIGSEVEDIADQLNNSSGENTGDLENNNQEDSEDDSNNIREDLTSGSENLSNPFIADPNTSFDAAEGHSGSHNYENDNRENNSSTSDDNNTTDDDETNVGGVVNAGSLDY